jgi:asparagine synthase (glutamine-hydrolysing)
MYCEPFADSSQIPTYLVAKMARQHVTVALSGDAGDELFGGYNRYLFGPAVRRRLYAWPIAVRRLFAGIIESVPPSRWDAVIHVFDRWITASARFSDAGDKLGKLARALRACNDAALYESFISQWERPNDIVIGAKEVLTRPDWENIGLGQLDFTERMMYQDTIGFLPNDVLTKIDRASMAVGLETRVPFLDHKLYEFAAALPMRFKIRNGVTKWLVRQVLYRYVPRELIDRPKGGFGIPIERWLRTDLRDWAESLISEDALARTGVFVPAPVRAAWMRHLNGFENQQHPLWCVLMFQAWYAHWSSQLSTGDSDTA